MASSDGDSSWWFSGDLSVNHVLRETVVEARHHPIRKFYRDLLTNRLSATTAIIAPVLLLAVFVGTRLLLRLFFHVYDRVMLWRRGDVITLAPFHSQSYWEREYARHPEQFEWYASYRDVRNTLLSYLSRRDKVLHVGCGTSHLAIGLCKEGIQHITNIDVSDQALRLARLAAADHDDGCTSHMSFKHQDVRSLPRNWSQRFDAAVDKGTLDAISCARAEGDSNVMDMLRQVERCLRPGGVFIVVTTVPEPSMRRWVAGTGFLIATVEHLVTDMSMRRVPVLPNDVWVLRKPGSKQPRRGRGRHDD